MRLKRQIWSTEPSLKTPPSLFVDSDDETLRLLKAAPPLRSPSNRELASSLRSSEEVGPAEFLQIFHKEKYSIFNQPSRGTDGAEGGLYSTSLKLCSRLLERFNHGVNSTNTFQIFIQAKIFHLAKKKFTLSQNFHSAKNSQIRASFPDLLRIDKILFLQHFHS